MTDENEHLEEEIQPIEEEIQPIEEEIQEPKDESTPEEIARAQRMGWIPKDQFKGDEKKWRPAKDFLEVGEQLLPILRERNKKLDTDLSEIKKNMGEFVAFTRAAAKREYEAKLTELEAKKDEAFDSGDKEAFLEADKEIAKLEKPVEAETKPKLDPDVQSWFDQNGWYKKDKELQSYADSMGDHFKRVNVKGGIELLDYVRQEVEKRFPARFDNPNRHNPPNVGDAGGNLTGGPGGGKKHSFNDLPNEAKTACNNWIRNGLGTREEYLKDYDWS